MTTDTTHQQPATEPIPTDPYLLAEYLRKLAGIGEQADVAERLAIQLGGTPDAIARACDLVDQALAEIRHGEEIARQRANLAAHIAAALHSIRIADGSLTALCGDLYDVEYAEGGQRVLDLRVFLDDAGRMLRAAATLNPCPTQPNGAGQ